MLLLSFPFALLAFTTILHFGYAAKFALNFNTHKNQTDNAMPVGTTSFIEMISKGVFIDKTLFLTYILKIPFDLDEFSLTNRYFPQPKYGIIAYPHNGGKTMNLQMLKTFLEIQVHSNGSRIEHFTETPNYQLFTKGKYHTKDVHIELEKPLLISNQKYRPIIDSYLSQYPVIYLSFAGICSTTKENYTVISGKLMADLFHHHKYMLEVYDRIITDKRGSEDTSFPQQFAEYKKKKFLSYLQNTAENTAEALKFLCEELREHFRKSVILLIDDYDRFFNIKGLHDHSSNFLYYTFAMGSEAPIMAVFFTGVIPLEFVGHGFFFTLSKRSPYPYYGFNQEEMKLLYKHYRVPPEEQKEIRHWYGGFNIMKEIRHWYGGFNIMKNPTNETYNPYSVCKFFNSRQFMPHWEDADDHEFELSKMFKSNEFLNAFAPLIVGKSVEIEYCRCIEPGSRTIVMSNFNQTFDFLEYAGYLTALDYRINELSLRFVRRYRIPNFETATILYKFFDRSLSVPLRIFNTTLLTLEKFLLVKSLHSLQLERQIQRCFEDMAKKPNKELLFRLVLKLVVRLNKMEFIHHQFMPDAYNMTESPDIVLWSKTRGVIIDVSHGVAVDTAIPLISRYLDFLEKYARLVGWQDVKLVFLHLTSDSCIQVTSIILPVSLDKLRRPSLRRRENQSLNLNTVLSRN